MEWYDGVFGLLFCPFIASSSVLDAGMRRSWVFVLNVGQRLGSNPPEPVANERAGAVDTSDKGIRRARLRLRGRERLPYSR